MMVSSTRSWKSVVSWLLAAFAALFVSVAVAGGIEIRSAGVVPGEDAFLLDADMSIELSPVLEDVVSRGVPLHFVVEFEINRPRWYWFDDKVAARTQNYRLSYHALTRQYRLSTGLLHQNFASVEEALRIISRLRQWPVADRSQLQPGESYEAALRLRVDLTQLPKPIQVSAIGSSEWALGSDWLRWRFSLSASTAK